MNAGASPSVVPLRWREAIIDRIEPRTPRVTSVYLQAGLGPHEAGQHVDVRLTAADGYQAQRSYSIASAPGAQSIELAIEALENGEVSPYFHDIARPGDAVELRGPIGGHFIWRVQDGGPLLLVAGGSGIVPLMAIARHRAVKAPSTTALLLYSARNWEEVVFRDELLRMQADDPKFMLVMTTTRGVRHRTEDFDRRIDRSMLREVFARWGHAPGHVYVCGSNDFVESAASSMVLEAITESRIRTERFGGKH